MVSDHSPSRTAHNLAPGPCKMLFLELPAEIRNNVYSHVFEPSANRTVTGDKVAYYHFSLGLLGVNKQVRAESQVIFHALNQFVLVETVWAEAETHVNLEGQVPIVVPGSRAESFTGWTLAARIGAAEFNFSNGTQCFVIHIDDWNSFTTVWRYSDLSHPGLNKYLSLVLEMHDPLAKSYDEPRISVATQKRLLLPLGIVKELDEVSFAGSPSPVPSVVAEMKRLMKEPHESPESCLRRATALKDDGNTALRQGRYDDAYECYRLAWLAMHIVVIGRKRYIHGDMYFNHELTQEPFKGMQGQMVRLALRVKLVANTVQLLLLMHRYDDARFWGMRTINMLRASFGLGDEAANDPEDEVIHNFMSVDIGKIYYRCAMAHKALEELPEARKLLKVASLYLPADRKVREEVMASAPRI